MFFTLFPRSEERVDKRSKVGVSKLAAMQSIAEVKLIQLLSDVNQIKDDFKIN
jgi:hypothetical protein